MLLIVTHKDDYTADFLIEKLNRRHIRYKRLNCEDLLYEPLSVDFDSLGVRYNILGQQTFSAVWFRRTKLPDFAELSYDDRTYILQETESFLKGLFTILGGKWLSNPFAVYKAEYKLYQLKVALDLGFTIPRTRLTNSKVGLLDFVRTNHAGTVIKPVEQTRVESQQNVGFIYTNRLDETAVATACETDLTPCIYQEYIEKDYELRITVVDEQVFCASVDSQSEPESLIDWRRKALCFRAATLPPEITARCIALVKKLGLSFGAIDLIKTKDGRYVFLEINPNGQWAWIESETGLPIGDAIINFLTI